MKTLKKLIPLLKDSAFVINLIATIGWILLLILVKHMPITVICLEIFFITVSSLVLNHMIQTQLKND
jgi:hypothetical protein